jgi:predicted TIM-barrel fold metal-dependent hydrolase
MIVDSQVHAWLPQSPERPWVRDQPHLEEPLTYERLRGMMAEAGVDAAVIVPPSWEGDRNDYALEAHRRYPDQFAVMGRLSVERPEARDEIEHFMDQPGMLGVRLTLHPVRHATWLSDGTLDWFWKSAERLDIPVMAHGPTFKRELGDVAARHPGLRLIIDHMGIWKDDVDDVMAAGAAETIALAKYPNVFVKLSAAPTFSTQPYPYRNIFAPIRRTIEAFGPQRCFWGSDFSRIRSTYRQAVTMFTEEMDFLSAEDKDWIMGRAIATCLHWPAITATVPS